MVSLLSIMHVRPHTSLHPKCDSVITAPLSIKLKPALQLYVSGKEIFLLPLPNLDLQVIFLHFQKYERNKDELGGTPSGVNYSTSQIVVSNRQFHTQNSIVISKKTFCVRMQRSFSKLGLQVGVTLLF